VTTLRVVDDGVGLARWASAIAGKMVAWARLH